MMKSYVAVGLCFSLMTMCLVKSTPLYPTIQMKHFSPIDICLFICNICFDDMGPEMMDCANHVCLAREQYEMVLGLIKVGRSCKNFNKLDSYLFGNTADDAFIGNNSE